jgi:osmotically-inducible protein OsmY
MTIAKLFPTAGLAVLLAAAIGCAPVETRQQPEEYLSDTWITTKVNAAVAADSELRVFDVKVDTFDGIVQLSGFVDRPDQITRAEQVAREVEGVRGVDNALRVKT